MTCAVLLSLMVGLVPIVSGGPTPIVLWHGMGDSCCNPLSMGALKGRLKDELPGVYVHSLMIGNNVAADVKNGFFKDTNSQIAMACDTIAKDPNLQAGYNAIGFSQGGQFLRAVAQRCPSPPMKNLITVGAQHQGVFGLPNCPGEIVHFCDIVRDLLNYGVYTDIVQSFLVQAQYWQDPLDHDLYVEKSQFIAEINNEKPEKNMTYAHNLAQLENFVMIKHNQDSMVEPRESEHFEFYQPGQAETIVPLLESPIYTEDRIGLKALHETGRLHFLSVDGDHLQFSWDWFREQIIQVYLS